MTFIITSGLGGNLLITQGYGQTVVSITVFVDVSNVEEGAVSLSDIEDAVRLAISTIQEQVIEVTVINVADLMGVTVSDELELDMGLEISNVADTQNVEISNASDTLNVEISDQEETS